MKIKGVQLMLVGSSLFINKCYFLNSIEGKVRVPWTGFMYLCCA